KPGDQSLFGRYTAQLQGSDFNFPLSDATLSDASYIRLQNVSLAYDFPGAWIKKFGSTGCKIYIRAQNLFVLTKYDGIDPGALSFGSLPPEKIFVAGLQFNF